MSDSDDILPELLTEGQIETLEDNPSIIADYEDQIHSAMESALYRETDSGRIDTLGEKLNLIFSAEVSDIESRGDIINSVMTLVINYNPEIGAAINRIMSDQSRCVLSNLKIDYGKELIRHANRDRKGRRWWSSIGTKVVADSGQTNLQHELTIDQSETVTFTADLPGAHMMSQHIIEQSKLAKNLLGFDILSEMNKDILEDIRDSADELIQDIEDYEEGEVETENTEMTDKEAHLQTSDKGRFDSESFE